MALAPLEAKKKLMEVARVLQLKTPQFKSQIIGDGDDETVVTIFLGPKDKPSKIKEFHGGPDDFLPQSADRACREALQYLRREYAEDVTASAYFDQHIYPTDAASWEHCYEQMATLYGEILEKKRAYRTRYTRQLHLNAIMRLRYEHVHNVDCLNHCQEVQKFEQKIAELERQNVQMKHIIAVLEQKNSSLCEELASISSAIEEPMELPPNEARTDQGASGSNFA